MQLRKKYLNLYIIAIMIIMAIFVSLTVPSSRIVETDGQVTTIPVEKDFSISTIVSSPIDSLIGINDGQTIKAGNTGASSGAISLVLLVLAIGSFVSVCSKVGVFDQLINLIISSNLSISKITILLVLHFGLCATTFGLYESAVCYIPLLLNLYKRFNVGPIFAVKVLILSTSIGYIASPINPFATIIADQVAGNNADMFTQRLILLAVLSIILILYLLVDLKRNSQATFASVNQESNQEKVHYLSLGLFIVPYLYMTIGFMPNIGFSATMSTVTMAFIATAIVIGLTSKLSLEQIIDQLFGGLNNFMIIAVSITLARTVYIILYNSSVIDTIIYKLVTIMSSYHLVLNLIAISLLYFILSYIIPSPSALAMLSLPIIAPAMELVGISIGATVTIFLLMHGISKMFSITSPVVITFLSEANIGYKAYVKNIAGFMAFVYIVTITMIISIS